MKLPCGHEGRGVALRTQRQKDSYTRRRSCPHCDRTFSTTETAQDAGMILQRSELSSFDSRKLQKSVENFCKGLTFLQTHQLLGWVDGWIQERVRAGVVVPSQELARTTTSFLARIDPVEAFRYGIHEIDTENPQEVLILAESGALRSKERE